jgi:hypothetical protein
MLENLRQAPDGPADRELRELVHESFELHLPPVYPDSQLFRGRDGLKRWTVKTREVWGVRLERDTAHVWTSQTGR